MNKIIDFNGAKQGKDNEQVQNVCEHCSIKSEIIYAFLVQLQSAIENQNDEELNDSILALTGEFYDDIYDEGKRGAYEDVLGYAGFNIDQIDGFEEEE